MLETEAEELRLVGQPLGAVAEVYLWEGLLLVAVWCWLALQWP